jgi:hypothetical protein
MREEPLVRYAPCVAVFVLGVCGPALAQEIDANLYRDRQYHFAAIFPETPKMREIAYTTKDGATIVAHQFYVERGTSRYFVTVVNLPDGPAVDYEAVEHAAERMRLRGEVRLEFDMAYDPGLPGRQLNIIEPDGRQLRASTYMWNHNLYIAEGLAAVGDLDALKIEQSLIMLDDDGNPVDTGEGNCPVAPP